MHGAHEQVLDDGEDDAPYGALLITISLSEYVFEVHCTHQIREPYLPPLASSLGK